MNISKFKFLLATILIFLLTTASSAAQGTFQPTPFIDLEYEYDAGGNVTSIINHINPDMSASMRYDDLGRLTGTSGPWGEGSYSYDAVGNRTSKKIGGEHVSYRYSKHTNLLDDVVHDSSGNIIADSKHRYVYDSENRLTEVWSGNTRVAAYQYDAFGRRISKTDINGRKTYYAYGRDSKVLTEFNGNGDPKFDYIYLGSQKIARVNHNASQYEERVSFYHANHLGSNIAVTDHYTSLVWDKEYLPFGGDYPDPNSDLIENDHQYTSQELDNDTGLYYFGARYYNPEIGRFMSVDPAGIDIANPQSWNRYAYVQNNPYKYVDPDGRQLVEFNSKEDAENFDPTSLAGPLSVIGPVKSLGSKIINSLNLYIRKQFNRANSVNNPIPKRVARVVDKRLVDRGIDSLGSPNAEDVFITASDDIQNINSSHLISNKLTLINNGKFRQGPFSIIEFDTPIGIATPINRTNPGFFGFGKTRGGAREFVIPNYKLDELTGITIRNIK